MGIGKLALEVRSSFFKRWEQCRVDKDEVCVGIVDLVRELVRGAEVSIARLEVDSLCVVCRGHNHTASDTPICSCSPLERVVAPDAGCASLLKPKSSKTCGNAAGIVSQFGTRQGRSISSINECRERRVEHR